jgi:CheY-like chemotaxis protein
MHAMQKILIVEDDPALLMLYATMIRNGGYEPLIAADAKTAINLLHHDTPNLIIEDLLLPDLEGVTLTHCIRQLPHCENIPVIILSASYGRIESARKSPEHFVAFLHKPIEQKDLLDVINQFITPEPDN